MSTEIDQSRTSWRKSSHSGSEGGDCVEIAERGAQIAVRDSKAPHGPVLAFPATAFGAFAAAAAAGGFDTR